MGKNALGIKTNNMGYKMNGFSGFKSSPAKHNDPKAKKKHGKVEGFFNEKVHKAWHMENTPGFIESGKRERDFSEHNIAARETEGTIEEQEARKKASEVNKPK